MKKKNRKSSVSTVGLAIIYALAVALILYVCISITKAIIYSDMPLWLKYMLLK